MGLEGTAAGAGDLPTARASCVEPSRVRPTPNDQWRRLLQEEPGGGFMPGLAAAPAPQHMRALAHANKVRLARAELKRQVADGELSAANVVLECPWEAESMAI